MVDDQLPTALEQIEESLISARALEHVAFIDADHRLPAPLGGERVAGAGCSLFLGDHSLVSGSPFGLRDNAGKGDRARHVMLRSVRFGGASGHGQPAAAAGAATATI